MRVKLDEILLLAGHLDDAPGFDAPRERFRRFLLEHVRDAAAASTLIAQCQFAPGEQHQRALQDLVVLLGRCLGFAISFGSYGGSAEWRSPARLSLKVHVKTVEIDRAESPLDESSPHLYVLTSPHVSRANANETGASAGQSTCVKVLALRTLLSIAEMMSAGRVAHDDVVQLLEPKTPAEFIVALLERVGQDTRATSRLIQPPADEPAGHAKSGPDAAFWLASVAPDHGTTPEEFLEVVVGRRNIFGVTEQERGENGIAHAGDFICFHIPGTGVVGHARIVSLAEGGAGMRDAHHYRQLLHLEGLELHLATPKTLDGETQLRLRAAQPAPSRRAHTIIRISRESFQMMTSPIIAGGSPSPE